MVKFYDRSDYSNLGQTTTDQYGNYSIPIPEYFNTVPNSRFIQISHPSGLFNTQVKGINFYYWWQGPHDDYESWDGSDLINGTNNEIKSDATLTVQNFGFQPSVFCTDTINANNIALDVLLREDIWNQYPYMHQAGFGTNLTPVLYNGERFIVVKNFTNSAACKKFFQNNTLNNQYLIRVTRNREFQFYPFNISTNQPSDNFVNFNIWNYKLASPSEKIPKNKSFSELPELLIGRTFNFSHQAQEGIITFNGKKRRDVLVTVSIQKQYLTRGTTSDFKTTVTTDANGYYRIDSLPFMNLNAIINIALMDHSVCNDSFLDSTQYKGETTVVKDVNFIDELFSVTGRLVDKNNAPLANAMVSIAGSEERTFTSDKGFYLLKSHSSGNKNLEVILDNYHMVSLPFVQPVGHSNISIDAVQWASKLKNTKAINAYLLANPSETINADLLGIGVGDLETRYKTYFNATEPLAGVIDLPQIMMLHSEGTLHMDVLRNGIKTKVLLKMSDGTTLATTENQTLETKLFPGLYKFDIVSELGGEQYVGYRGEFVIRDSATTTQIVYLNEGVLVKGKVSNKNNGAVLPAAQITVQGLPVPVFSNELGEYSMVVPKGQQLNFHVSCKKYNSTDTAINFSTPAGLNFQLEERSTNLPSVTTLSGFAVSIDKQDLMGEDSFLISGKVAISGNDVFSIAAEDGNLSFKNIIVKMDGQTENAIPLAGFSFEEAVVQTKAFGFATIEARGLQMIAANNQTDFKLGAIGSSNTLLRTTTLVGSLPFAFTTDGKFSNAVTTLFVAPNTQLNTVSVANNYTIELPANTDVNEPDADHYKVSIGFFATLHYTRNTIQLNKDGIGLNGYMTLPRIAGITQLLDIEKIPINEFHISKDIKIDALSLLVNDGNPLKWNFQKCEARLTKFILSGFESVNMKTEMSGYMHWLKPSLEATTDSLTIQEIVIENKEKGITLSGALTLPEKGLKLKSLVFTTPNDNGIVLGYNFDKSSFEFTAQGVLDIDADSKNTFDGGTISALGDIFPLDISTFKLSSKNWDVAMAVNTNTTIDLKIASLNITALLVSVGNSLSLDEMSKILTKDTTSVTSASSGDGVVPDAGAVSWGIGIVAEVKFDLKCATIGASGILVIAQTTDGMKVQLNKLGLHMASTGFSLDAQIDMAFDADKRGFAVDADLNVMEKIFKVDLKYYSYPGGNYDIGAALKANIGNFVTGSVKWYSIGGGFSYNSITTKFIISFQGDVGMEGTTQDMGYVKNGNIELLFQSNTCGAKPVLTGSGELWMKGSSCGNATVKIDFCNLLLLATIEATIQPAPTTTLAVKAVVYLVAKQGNADGAIFLAASCDMDLVGIVKGNAILAIGVNFKYNDNLPQEIKDFWPLIDVAAKSNNATEFNGFYLEGHSNPPTKSASFDVSIADVPLLAFSYSFSTSAAAKLYYNYTSSVFMLKATVTADARAYINILGLSLNGSAYVNATIEGGHDDRWYLSGDISAGLQLWNNTNQLNCNSSTIYTIEKCFDNVPYPCGWTFWEASSWCSATICIPIPIINFKVCENLSAHFSLREGQSPSVGISY